MNRKKLARGRVVNVRSRNDGTFAVTLIGGIKSRSYLWLVASAAPRLGDLIEFEGAELVPCRASSGELMTIVEGGRMIVIPDQYQRRFVPPQWIFACQRSSERTLFPHQIEAAGWMAERISRGKGSLLADDPGLGKTTSVLAALVTSKALPAIIICPHSLKISWQREAHMLNSSLVTNVVDGNKGRIDPAHLLIANYSLLRGREAQFRGFGAKCIVFDEGHGLKSPTPDSTHRAAVSTRLARSIGPAIVMTGTPMPNRPQELWRLLHLVDPDEWPSYEEYRDRYCSEPDEDDVLGGREFVTDQGSIHNLDELHARMAPCMIRRLKSNVLPNLPKKTRKIVSVHLSPADRAVYTAAEKDVVAWLRSLGRGVRANAAEHGKAVVKLTMLRRIAAMGKLRTSVEPYLTGWFDAAARRPLVVFAYHRDVLRGAREICRRLGLTMACIDSRDPSERRQRAIDSFTAGDADVFIAPILAAGVGLNLQSASDVLFLERVWVPSEMAQAEDRVHRMGQTRPVTISYLDAVDTIDDHMACVVKDKQSLIDAVVDDRTARGAKDDFTRSSMEDVLELLSR